MLFDLTYLVLAQKHRKHNTGTQGTLWMWRDRYTIAF